ncbi:MAG TPA: (d)CMP kinase [Rhodothermia bacterium]
MIIAIDGPAGSGKSTTARAVARALGFLYVDTGAMYRAVALAVHRAQAVRAGASALDLIDDIDIRLSHSDEATEVFLQAENITDAIRTPEISRLASIVAQEGRVREAMVQKQRDIVHRITGAGGGAVVEGRDIGTVVFPEAELKVYLDADANERARRRRDDLAARGRDVSQAEMLQHVTDRDAEDIGRTLAPLRPADDARHLDTTTLQFEDQVAQIVSWATETVGRPAPA